MTKVGSKIFGMTEGIKPRERVDGTPARIKSAPGMFLDTQHRAAKAEAENAVLRNRHVNIADLTVVDGRRRQLSEQEFAELTANLANFPLINPVTIRALPSGGYELISGHNRVQAFLKLGRTEIEANIIELAEEQVLPAAFYSNLLSPSLPDYEKYLGFKQLQSATGKTQTELASESGMSKAMISMLFSFEALSAASHAVLSQHPRIASATLAARLKQLPFADAAIARLAQGGITQQQALAFASKKPETAPARTKPDTIIIKREKKRFAEVSSRGATVMVKLVDESLMPVLLKKIEVLLRAEMAAEGHPENS